MPWLLSVSVKTVYVMFTEVGQSSRIETEQVIWRMLP